MLKYHSIRFDFLQAATTGRTARAPAIVVAAVPSVATSLKVEVELDRLESYAKFSLGQP